MKTNEPDGEKRTVIGKIIGTHGVRGKMLIAPITDYPERFLDMEELVLDLPGKPRRTLKVSDITPYEGKGLFFLTAEGVDGKDAADAYKGSIITVAQDERVELPEDEFWIDDIIGLAAEENGSGKVLGVVEEVMETGSNDVYLIRTPEGELKPIPATDQAVNKVDLENKKLLVTIPEGLWD
jgi:16S rRNA processing protein RimM